VEVIMKKAGLGAAMLALMVAAGTAGAADFHRAYTVPAPLGFYSWAGPYLGANVGYQWGTITNNPTRPSGIIGGVQAGYNWQTGQFVFGGEIDLQWSAADDVFAPWKFANPWFGTLRGRVGYAMNNILLFGTLGVALGGVRAELGPLEESRTHFGWSAGVGMEVGLTPNWSAKAEYLYVDLADRNYVLTGTANGLESSILRLGVNYRF
jgi:outer membrane immunogenic protein